MIEYANYNGAWYTVTERRDDGWVGLAMPCYPHPCWVMLYGTLNSMVPSHVWVRRDNPMVWYWRD